MAFHQHESKFFSNYIIFIFFRLKNLNAEAVKILLWVQMRENILIAHLLVVRVCQHGDERDENCFDGVNG